MAEMDMKEKLVESLDDIQRCGEGYTDHEIYGMRLPDTVSNEDVADHLITNGVTVQEWISVEDKLPQNFVSVLGYMTDAGEFPPVRECYTVGNAFFFPALGDVHPVSHWREMPQPPKGE